MSDTTAKPLTAPDVLALAAIVQAAHGGARVGRATEEGALAGPVQYGTARHIVLDERCLFPGPDTDIRDCELWVSCGISERFWPVALLVEEYHAGTFVINPA